MQDELRIKTNNFIKQHGVKARFICLATNINEAFFSCWRRGKEGFELNEESYIALDQYLNKVL